MFYRAAIQSVLLFGGETWVLLSEMERNVEGTHTFFLEDHGEEVTLVAIRYMGDARGGSSAGSDRNAVGNGLHRETTGNHSTVGSVATDSKSVNRQEGIQGGRFQEGHMVASRGKRETHLGKMEARSSRQQGEGVIQWEPGDGRRRAGIRDYGSETSNACVGE